MFAHNSQVPKRQVFLVVADYVVAGEIVGLAKLYEVNGPVLEQAINRLQQAATLKQIEVLKNNSLIGQAINRQINKVASIQRRFERLGHSAVGQPTHYLMEAGEEQMRVDNFVLGQFNPPSLQSRLQEDCELKFGGIHGCAIARRGELS